MCPPPLLCNQSSRRDQIMAFQVPPRKNIMMVLFLQKFPASLDNILLPVVVSKWLLHEPGSVQKKKNSNKIVEIAKEQTRYETTALPKAQDAAHLSLLFWLCSDTRIELRAHFSSLLFWLYCQHQGPSSLQNFSLLFWLFSNARTELLAVVL